MSKMYGTKQLRGRGSSSSTLELTVTKGAKELDWNEGDHILIKEENGKLILRRMEA